MSIDNINWQSRASTEMLKQRADIIAGIREFMAQRSILEVETPILDMAGNTDPNIQSLTTVVNSPLSSQSQTYYLHTSPEFAMKRLLAAGSGPIYQITKVFRDYEAGKIHQPEFTMLEWYRPGFNHHDLMNEIDELLIVLNLQSSERMTYAALFGNICGLDPHTSDISELREKAGELGLNTLTDDRSLLLDVIFSHAVVPTLAKQRPVFIYDYPVCHAALAKIRKDDNCVAERFELFINCVEIANGYNELCDVIEVNNRFLKENEIRLTRGLPEIKIDKRLLAALKHGMPACAGVALGLDRLVMVITGSKELKDVIAFPQLTVTEETCD